MQSKYYANLSITILTLGLVFYFQNIATVLSFGIAILNLAFHSYLARASDVKRDSFAAEIKLLQDQIEALNLSIGLRR